MQKYKWLIILGTILAILASLVLSLKNQPSGQVVSGITKDPSILLASDNGKTNVLFLGVGGKNHQGGDLTDSIILISYDHTSHHVTLISVPRDIWVPTLSAKINAAYHLGNEKLAGSGKAEVKKDVSEILGVKIQYAVILDFAGFEKVIDTVGGVDINVANTFDDYMYPIAGMEDAEPESLRYEHLHFDAGPAHMDGVTALKFARSRHALGDEGTDFARSKRQEKVIVAFKEKLLSSKILLSPSTLQTLVKSVTDSLDTDISDTELGGFIHIFLSYAKSNESPKSFGIEDLYLNPKNTTRYAGAWVLIPKTKQEDIYAFVANALNN